MKTEQKTELERLDAILKKQMEELSKLRTETLLAEPGEIQEAYRKKENDYETLIIKTKKEIKKIIGTDVSEDDIISVENPF